MWELDVYDFPMIKKKISKRENHAVALWQVGVVSDYDLLALDSISGNAQFMMLVLVLSFILLNSLLL